MPKLASLLRDRGRIEIAVPGDEPLVVEYRRDIMTPRMQARMMLFQATDDAERATEALDFFCDLYSRLIVSWNLTDAEGVPLGTDAESLKDIQLEVLSIIAREIGRQTQPDPLSDGGSNNGSSPTESSALHLTTTGSS